MRALCVCRSDRAPKMRHAACHEKHDAVEKGEDGELLPSMAQAHSRRERETHPHHTHPLTRTA